MPRCKECKEKFEAKFFLQKYCMKKTECIAASKVINQKKIVKGIENLSEKQPTHANWIQVYQKIFNKYIRLRDKGKPCACCNRALGSDYDAGHAYSVAMFPNLRFDEDNVHGQRKDCNSKDDQTEYQLYLFKRIGKMANQKLVEKKNDLLKISIPEIQERIIYYKNLIKILSK